MSSYGDVDDVLGLSLITGFWYWFCSSQWLALHLLVLGFPPGLPCTSLVLGLLLATPDLL
jgi:hypothetical protein